MKVLVLESDLFKKTHLVSARLCDPIFLMDDKLIKVFIFRNSVSNLELILSS